MITIFCLALFVQLIFKLLFLSEEDRVKLTYFLLAWPQESVSPSSALWQPSGIDSHPKSV
jgi:hypothetical protein